MSRVGVAIQAANNAQSQIARCPTVQMSCQIRPKMPYRDKQGDSSDCLCTRYITRKLKMLFTLAVVLIILWLLGVVTSVTAGGLIHILLVVAIVVILLRIISGRRVL